MNWTRETPAQEGWYWFRPDNEEQQRHIVYVINAQRMVTLGTEIEQAPGLQPGAWYGPLEAPPYEERESQP